jgi:L-arabinose isomerase
VLSTAVGTPELRHLAEMLHTELVVIDRAASVEGVRDRLRWSAAYHRLTTQLSV